VADNYKFRAGDGTTQTRKAKDTGGGVYANFDISMDASGNVAPSGDVIARSKFVAPGDGTNPFLSGSAANLAAQSSVNAQLVTEPGQWAATHGPAVNVKATCNQAAGGAGVRNVCQAVSINLAGDSTAPAATVLTVNLRDGATGAGTILMTWTIAIPATAGAFSTINLSGLNIPGTAATAMTLEFTAAGGAHTFESVSMSGTTCV
jgi:hypothetical protein